MKTAAVRSFDVLFNVCLPILTGFSIYMVATIGIYSPIIKNYIADGLWAYSFMSAMLIVWERNIRFVWVALPFIIATAFEWLQLKGTISGTADMYDLATYFISMLISLSLNPFFKYQFKKLPNQQCKKDYNLY